MNRIHLGQLEVQGTLFFVRDEAASPWEKERAGWNEKRF